jgi:DNA-directed RNA polymerase specialized sigma24 family protein
MKNEIQIEIQRRRPFMLAVAYRIVKNWDAAEDIVQDAMVNTLKRRQYEPCGLLEHEQKRFLTWLGSVVRNTAGDYLKSPSKGLNRMIPMSQLDTVPEESYDPCAEMLLDLSNMTAKQATALGTFMDRSRPAKSQAKKGASLVASVGIEVRRGAGRP